MKKICFIYVVVFMFSFVSSSFALTAGQIIQLKKAGVSDETIQIMLKQEKKFPRKIKDDEGNEYIIYSTDVSSLNKKLESTEDENVKRAWKMLENIIIDARQ
ncbi:MAG: hypothetical protein KJN62_03005 [Deltaproteobacteria bacterium]|nr:hypothetical protein [Deltaproteobacteria bacterium]